MAKLVSKTYGDALFELALEEDRLDSFFEEVKAVSQILEENEELTQLMSHPKIVKEEKIQIIKNIFAGRISKELDGVLIYFMDRYKEQKNIGTAYVTSAVELSEAQKEATKKRLLETTRYVEFEMHYDVDAALIGGMVIRIGDRVVDSSIKTKLQDLTRELSKIQLKGGECAP